MSSLKTAPTRLGALLGHGRCRVSWTEEERRHGDEKEIGCEAPRGEIETARGVQAEARLHQDPGARGRARQRARRPQAAVRGAEARGESSALRLSPRARRGD